MKEKIEYKLSLWQIRPSFQNAWCYNLRYYSQKILHFDCVQFACCFWGMALWMEALSASQPVLGLCLNPRLQAPLEGPRPGEKGPLDWPAPPSMGKQDHGRITMTSYITSCLKGTQKGWAFKSDLLGTCGGGRRRRVLDVCSEEEDVQSLMQFC